MKPRTARMNRTNWRCLTRIVWLVPVGMLLVLLACSSASQHYLDQRPPAGPGVVYVAEQIHSLEEWARGPESRSYARVYSRAGEADEGQLVRITANSVVLFDDDQSKTAADEVQIAKADVLFMRVWW